MSDIRLGFLLSRELHSKFKTIAFLNGITMTEMLVKLVKEEVEKEKETLKIIKRKKK